MKPNNPPQTIVFKAPEPLRAWLAQKAAEGYRTINAQVRLIVEAAMKAEAGNRK
jgi:hypothetical protein